MLCLALALVLLARVALVLGGPLSVHHCCVLPLATDLAVLHKVAAVNL